jgi:hypothetical protein
LNIFFLSNEPTDCATQHVDKHVVKMVLEYGQLMSTAHRVLDGVPYTGKTVNNRNIQRWLLEDEREQHIWKASHVKHPSGIWVRASITHYRWLFSLWVELLKEYTYRYDKVHSAERMKVWFETPPNNIPIKGWLSDPTPAMPDEYKVPNAIHSYRNYYTGAKKSFASWKKREVPSWFV